MIATCEECGRRGKGHYQDVLHGHNRRVFVAARPKNPMDKTHRCTVCGTQVDFGRISAAPVRGDGARSKGKKNGQAPSGKNPKAKEKR